MACTAPDALDPTARWSLENTITTPIIDRITVASTALLAYTALVVLVLMVRRSSADLIKPSIKGTRSVEATWRGLPRKKSPAKAGLFRWLQVLLQPLLMPHT
jgi:hypothetical protein